MRREGPAAGTDFAELEEAGVEARAASRQVVLEEALQRPTRMWMRSSASQVRVWPGRSWALLLGVSSKDEGRG